MLRAASLRGMASHTWEPSTERQAGGLEAALRAPCLVGGRGKNSGGGGQGREMGYLANLPKSVSHVSLIITTVKHSKGPKI